MSLSWGDLVKDAGESGGGSFEPLPDGDYDFKVVEATAATTSSQKTMFKIKAQVQGGAFNNRLVWDNLVVSPDNPNALGFFFRKMAALGLGTDFFNQNPSNAQIESALAGRTFRGKVGSRVYQGQKRNEFKSYAPSTGGVAQSAPAPAPQAAPAPSPAPAPAPQAAPAPQQAAPAPAQQAAPQQDPWAGQQPAQPQWGAPQAPAGNQPPAPPF